MATADTGDTGDTGSVSLTVSGAGSGGIVVRPSGVSPSLCPVAPEPTFRGNGWPPADVELGLFAGDPPRTWLNVDPRPVLGFLGRGWANPWSPWAILTKFAQSDDWYNDATLRAALDAVLPAKDDDELLELVLLKDARPGMLAEAVGQADVLAPWFAGVMGFNGSSHPATSLLVSSAALLGTFVVMHWKAEYNRPRPSRVSPELMPPLAVPGHLSFPSGHATQSALIAWTLAQVMPQAAWDVADTATDCAHWDPATKPTDASLLPSGPLFRMAERIGRNREVLGLHFPSDSRAGRILAWATFPHFVARMPKVAVAAGGGAVEDLWVRARTEWQAAGLNPPMPVWPLPV